MSRGQRRERGVECSRVVIRRVNVRDASGEMSLTEPLLQGRCSAALRLRSCRAIRVTFLGSLLDSVVRVGGGFGADWWT